MEDAEILNIWKDYDRRIEESKILNMQSWALNLQCFESLQKQRAESALKPFVRHTVTGIIAGILWLLFLGFLLFVALTNFSMSSIFFVVSIGMIFIANILAVGYYIKHIAIVKQINYNESVTKAQEQLAALQASMINIVRILFLQMPFYCTWFVNRSMFVNAGAGMWVLQIGITAFFTFAAIWLYRNINYKNAHKKWFKLLFSAPSFVGIGRAMEFMKEIERFKEDVG